MGVELWTRYTEIKLHGSSKSRAVYRMCKGLNIPEPPEEPREWWESESYFEEGLIRAEEIQMLDRILTEEGEKYVALMVLATKGEWEFDADDFKSMREYIAKAAASGEDVRSV